MGDAAADAERRADWEREQYGLDAVPGYWPNETSGVLRPVVEKYLAGAELDEAEVATMRAYLRQWVAAPGFVGDEVEGLRAAVAELRTSRDVETWLARAFVAGIDPL